MQHICICETFAYLTLKRLHMRKSPDNAHICGRVIVILFRFLVAYCREIESESEKVVEIYPRKCPDGDQPIFLREKARDSDKNPTGFRSVRSPVQTYLK